MFLYESILRRSEYLREIEIACQIGVIDIQYVVCKAWDPYGP